MSKSDISLRDRAIIYIHELYICNINIFGIIYLTHDFIYMTTVLID